MDIFRKKGTKPMYLRPEGNKEPGTFVSGWVSLEWASRDTNPDGTPAEIRNPEPVTVKGNLLDEIRAAGKLYHHYRDIAISRMAENGLWADCFGRQVLCFKERFPCFDSYDYLHENRYYRWCLIREGDKLTVVAYADTQKWVEVTEDAAKVNAAWWEEIRKHWGE